MKIPENPEAKAALNRARPCVRAKAEAFVESATDETVTRLHTLQAHVQDMSEFQAKDTLVSFLNILPYEQAIEGLVELRRVMGLPPILRVAP